MKWRIAVVVTVLAAGALAAVVYAQLGGMQTASGSVNVTTTASADLYVCEPDSTPGPDCGSDDSGADEMVFETLEDMLPGGTAEWDIRLKNVGSEDWVIVEGGQFDAPIIVEGLDPADDCPEGALREPFPTSVTVLGKNGDELNDNIVVDGPEHIPGAAIFVRESLFPSQWDRVQVKVAPGDYEDLRLRLELAFSVGWDPPITTANCDGNEWNVSWNFTALPVSP